MLDLCTDLRDAVEYESGTIGAKPDVLPLSIGDGELATTADTVVSTAEIDRIGELAGVETTISSILLATKWSRGDRIS